MSSEITSEQKIKLFAISSHLENLRSEELQRGPASQEIIFAVVLSLAREMSELLKYYFEYYQANYKNSNGELISDFNVDDFNCVAVAIQTMLDNKVLVINS